MKVSTPLLAAAVVGLSVAGFSSPASALTVASDVFLVSPDGPGKQVGTVIFTDTDAGLEIKTNFQGLPPGDHGFHIHEFGDCNPGQVGETVSAALAAGGHYDPGKTGKHLGPNGGGHKGDLPVLKVEADGTARTTMVIPHLEADEIRTRAIIIHEGGDNYSDTPKANGGGGGRLACGLIERR